MEPNLKLVLDEMKSMKQSLEGSIAAVNTSLGDRIGAVERTISDRLSRLEDAARVFDEWKPTVDASVQELRSEIGAIRKSEDVMEKMREEMTALRKTVSRAALDACNTPGVIVAN
jgi:DNA repair ATPase RecN